MQLHEHPSPPGFPFSIDGFLPEKETHSLLILGGQSKIDLYLLPNKDLTENDRSNLEEANGDEVVDSKPGEDWGLGAIVKAISDKSKWLPHKQVHPWDCRIAPLALKNVIITDVYHCTIL